VAAIRRNEREVEGYGGAAVPLVAAAPVQDVPGDGLGRENYVVKLDGLKFVFGRPVVPIAQFCVCQVPEARGAEAPPLVQLQVNDESQNIKAADFVFLDSKFFA
jgi:hypothetical protein